MPAEPLSLLPRGEEDRRELLLWAVSCAERVLPLFEQAVPGDARPREALAGARAFADGRLRLDEVRRLTTACAAAAKQAPAGVARVAARACGRASGIAHLATHARAVPTDTLKALALAGAAAPVDVPAEAARQRSALPDRLHAVVYPAG
jgi:hypothetical protein